MLYHLHEAQRTAFAPWRLMAEAVQQTFSHPWQPLAHTRLGRSMAAGADMFERATRRYEKPPFGIDHVMIDDEPVAVREVAVMSKPFGTLLHFRRETERDDPRVLLVAPLSGHYATLLRGTVQALLADHDVWITDWDDAAAVPFWHGSFHFDDYVDYLVEFLHHLGPRAHVVAVCQPSVPVMAAVSLMAQGGDPMQPASMTLMGGPIDTRVNPTAVNEFATSRSLAWFQRRVIHTVPLVHAGAGRRVYPGFLQLSGFMSMNLDRHIGAYMQYFEHLVEGDGDGAAQHRDFYDEYLSVMDLPAEYFLETIDRVFQRHFLPRGLLTWRGHRVEPAAIARTALMTIEGERDDISGPGQTKAAHELCSGLAADRHRHHLQPKVGHYGIFNGRRWREDIYPRLRDFIQTSEAGG